VASSLGHQNTIRRLLLAHVGHHCSDSTGGTRDRFAPATTTVDGEFSVLLAVNELEKSFILGVALVSILYAAQIAPEPACFQKVTRLDGPTHIE